MSKCTYQFSTQSICSTMHLLILQLASAFLQRRRFSTVPELRSVPLPFLHLHLKTSAPSVLAEAADIQITFWTPLSIEEWKCQTFQVKLLQKHFCSQACSMCPLACPHSLFYKNNREINQQEVKTITTKERWSMSQAILQCDGYSKCQNNEIIHRFLVTIVP